MMFAVLKKLHKLIRMDETVEKAAKIYMLTAHLPRVNIIKDSKWLSLPSSSKLSTGRIFLTSDITIPFYKKFIKSESRLPRRSAFYVINLKS